MDGRAVDVLRGEGREGVMAGRPPAVPRWTRWTRWTVLGPAGPRWTLVDRRPPAGLMDPRIPGQMEMYLMGGRRHEDGAR